MEVNWSSVNGVVMIFCSLCFQIFKKILDCHLNRELVANVPDAESPEQVCNGCLFGFTC